MTAKGKVVLLVAAVLVAIGGYLYLSPTPHFGGKLPVKGETPDAIEVQFLGKKHETRNPTYCYTLVEALRTARGGGPPCACPPLGKIMLHYSNGETATLHIQPGHRMTRIAVVLSGQLYEMGSGKLLDSLDAVGVPKRSQ